MMTRAPSLRPHFIAEALWFVQTACLLPGIPLRLSRGDNQ
jgi:hypothetical protein